MTYPAGEHDCSDSKWKTAAYCVEDGPNQICRRTGYAGSLVAFHLLPLCAGCGSEASGGMWGGSLEHFYLFTLGWGLMARRVPRVSNFIMKSNAMSDFLS